VFSYFKLKVFYPDVAYIFTHMFEVYVPDVLTISDVCFIQVFDVVCVSCGLESQVREGVMVARHGRGGTGYASWWPADMARSTFWAGGRGARRGEVRLRGRANVWGREIKADGRTASECWYL
jgi:hypothetical protein